MNWTPERRAAHLEMLRLLRPWLKSTGPKTLAGKARSARNALRHGRRSRSYNEAARELTSFLRRQAAWLAAVRAHKQRGFFSPNELLKLADSVALRGSLCCLDACCAVIASPENWPGGPPASFA